MFRKLLYLIFVTSLDTVILFSYYYIENKKHFENKIIMGQTDEVGNNNDVYNNLTESNRKSSTNQGVI
jgi:hypothetical protein